MRTNLIWILRKFWLSTERKTYYFINILVGKHIKLRQGHIQHKIIFLLLVYYIEKPFDFDQNKHFEGINQIVLIKECW